jgi:Domain of unknown function (DUF4438), N-terminal/Domain of unknown function (DUF4438), C-terminal
VLLVRRRGAGELTAPRGQSPRINGRDLVIQAVIGEITNPIGRANPYRIGNDGVPRILPGPGGIVLNRRIGDYCVGLAVDHVEPGVSLRNHERGAGVAAADGPNLALMTSTCIGNPARVVTGPCRGATGIVTGKHGGVNHVLVDFDTRILSNLNIGDRVQVYSCGLGLQLLDHPDITVSNCSPGLLRRWSPTHRGGMLEVRVTHVLPAAIVGSGRGQYTVSRADFDIELFDARVRERFGLDRLRFGDLVCVRDADSRFGFSWRSGRITIGVIAHSDSTVSGHGPGIVVLMTGPASRIRPVFDPNANIAALYERRRLAPRERKVPVAGRSRPGVGRLPRVRPDLRLDTPMRLRHHARYS